MGERLTDKFFSRKYARIYVAATLLIWLAYYGVPLVFLRAPVQEHLENKYGVHVDIGSVRVSARGLVVTDVSAVWPSRNATMSVREMMLGFSPFKSLARRRLVFERLKILYPTITVRLPDPSRPSPPQEEPGAVEDSGETPPAPAPSAAHLPPSFDLMIRRGKIHVMRGPWSVVIEPLDVEVERTEPGRIEAWMKLDSREMGGMEVTFEEGKDFKLEADAISLAMLTEITGSPQKVQGQLSANVRRVGESFSGDIKLDGLIWTGPDPHFSMDTEEGVDPLAATPPVSPETSVIQETAPVETAPAAAPEETSPAIAIPQVNFIYPPLDARLSWKGLWSRPDIRIDAAELSVDGVRIQASGALAQNRRLDADLDFYVPAFDEPTLEKLSEHFHVLRYLHKFLESIQSPSNLQAKMHLKGPLTRPVDWHYQGLVDIRRDTFSYEPFLGQYSFLGTVEFDDHGVRIPEILMPFGAANLVLSGTAADYSTKTARMTLKGSGLTIGPMIQFYIPDALKSPDTSAANVPAGLADVDLELTRFGQPWNLSGSIDFKRVSVPIRNVVMPRAYGKITFAGSRADGSILVRLGSFETAINPFVRDLFTPDVEYGVYFKQADIRWEKLVKALTAPGPVPYLPTGGRGDISLKFYSAPRLPPATDSGAPNTWRADGTMEVRDGAFRLPPFATPVDSVSAFLSFEGQQIFLQRASGVLAGNSVKAQGRSLPGDPRSWTLEFQTPDLNLASLLEDIQPGRESAEPKPFDVSADVRADKFKFHAFEIPSVTGKFQVTPGRFSLRVDTPIRTDYQSVSGENPSSEISFVTLDSFPVKKLFSPAAAMSGDISGTVVLRGKTLSDSRAISGEMDLLMDRLSFKKAPPLLKLLDLMRLSFTDAVVFNPIHFKSEIVNGTVDVDLDQTSNVGRWIIKGKLGLDAAYMPLSEETDSFFHVSFYPRENIVTRILNESKILDLLGGKREGIKLDFHLVGNYNNSNILWTEEPFVSVIRGRVSELVPGFFAAPSPSDTERSKPKNADDGSAPSQKSSP